MPPILKKRLLQAATALAITGAGVVGTQVNKGIPPEVVLAMEIGAHYESSGRHIGTPYVDKLGKGQPLTVCNGITGEGVVAGRYYTPEDCKKLELPHYTKARELAKARLKYWDSYNVWVKASFIDMGFNVPSAFGDTTVVRLANAGDLDGACAQMPRWVMGTVNGKSTRLPGLVDRRDTTEELCAEWGRTGHFTQGLVK